MTPDIRVKNYQARQTRARRSPGTQVDLFPAQILGKMMESKEILELRKLGKLERTLRFFALNGPSNIYKFAKANHMAYSVAHGLIKRLERLGFVEVISVVKNEKGATAKLYGLLPKGFREALGYCRNRKEMNKIVKEWAKIDKSGLLEKWDYIVGKVGENNALNMVRSSISYESPIDEFVKNILDFLVLYGTDKGDVESKWIHLLMDDNQFRKITLLHVEGRITIVNQEIAKLRDEKKFYEKLRGDLMKHRQK